jgi:hypothetical protein
MMPLDDMAVTHPRRAWCGMIFLCSPEPTSRLRSISSARGSR